MRHPRILSRFGLITFRGSGWSYSGGGYSIVQLMVSEASGQAFDQYMKAAVLNPLGMTHSTFITPLPSNSRDLAATAYDGSGKAVEGQGTTIQNLLLPAYGARPVTSRV